MLQLLVALWRATVAFCRKRGTQGKKGATPPITCPFAVAVAVLVSVQAPDPRGRTLPAVVVELAVLGVG